MDDALLPPEGTSLPGPRDEHADALRGLGITLVVLGHALVSALEPVAAGTSGAVLLQGVGPVRLPLAFAMALNAIYSFHIPLLAFVSGYVLTRTPTTFGRRFVTRRFAALMVPYLAWLAVNWAIAGERSLLGFARFMGVAMLDPQSAGALWFLYALFVSCAVLAFVMRLGGSDARLLASALVVGALGVLPLGRFEHVLGLSDVAWVYPFVVAGVLVGRHRASFARRLPVGFLAATVVWLVSLPLVWQVLVPGDRWWYASAGALLQPLGASGSAVVLKAAWAIVRVLGALAGVLGAYAACCWLRGWLLHAAAWVGRRTLGVYAIHGYLLLLPLAALQLVPRAALLFALALAGSLAATMLLERTSLTRKVLLGARR